jgi:hypothetical protein
VGRFPAQALARGFQAARFWRKYAGIFFGFKNFASRFRVVAGGRIGGFGRFEQVALLAPRQGLLGG